MILCPIKGNARITQHYGDRPEVYSQFGMKAHGAIDLTGAVRGELVDIHSPYDALVWEVGDQGNGGYGKFVRLLTDKDGKGQLREVVLAHLSEVNVKQGERVYLGDKIGVMGNTGFSSAPHLHLGLRRRDAKTYAILNYNNGYKGYIDFEDYLLPWGVAKFQYPYG